MMNQIFGARNTAGFSSSVYHGQLPSESHITYEGAFNQLKFKVGNRTEKLTDLHFGYARYQFGKSQLDNKINDYLAIFLKGSKDGEDRDQRPLNAVICLDISGSMSCILSDGNQAKSQAKSRIKLAQQGIKMFISKLRPNDSVGMTTFDDNAHIIFKPTQKSEISQKIFDLIDQTQANGGNDLKKGFLLSQQLLMEYIKANQCKNCENRIIILSDACDNSLDEGVHCIEEASVKYNIHLTIVGISNDFRSELCQWMKNIKGFNYFCAVNQNDIKKYIFETFDFGFFPSVYDINIAISSEDLESFQVYGSPDSDKVSDYNEGFAAKQTYFTVSKLATSFPSEIEIDKDVVSTFGGLILLKLKRKSHNPFFKGEVTLNYKDEFGKQFQEKYPIHYEFHPQEQFFSDQTLRQAIQAFAFVSQTKVILKAGPSIYKPEQSEKYLSTLNDLRQICPKQKLKDLNSMIKIMQKYAQNKPKSQEITEVTLE